MIEYLEALNKLFEKSILGSKVRVFKSDGTTMSRMSEGFNFFAKWAKKSASDDQEPTTQEKKCFLAWQVNLLHAFYLVMLFNRLHFFVDMGSVTDNVVWVQRTCY